MTRIIAMAAQKGGVGKTTSTINLGAALAEYGRRVLLVDLDPSGQITDALGLEGNDRADLASVILRESDATPAELVVSHSSGLDVIPWHKNMITLGERLVSERGREHRLQKVLAAYTGVYDYILIDFAPTLGVLTDMGLVASQNGEPSDTEQTGAVIFPVEASKLMHRTLELMIEQIEQIEAAFGRRFTRLGMICGIYNEKDGHATKEAFDKLCEGDLHMIGVVRRRTLFKEAMGKGLTIFQHAPESDAAQWFTDIAKKVDAQ